jgi:hypothetical protein
MPVRKFNVAVIPFLLLFAGAGSVFAQCAPGHVHFGGGHESELETVSFSPQKVMIHCSKFNMRIGPLLVTSALQRSEGRVDYERVLMARRLDNDPNNGRAGLCSIVASKQSSSVFFQTASSTQAFLTVFQI